MLRGTAKDKSDLDGKCRSGKTFSKKGKRKNHYAQAKRLYLNRAFGSDCHHCVIDSDIAAGTAAG